MDMQTSKLELVKMIVDLDNYETVEKLLSFLRKDRSSQSIKLTKAEKEEIKLGIKQLDAGEMISLEDFITKARI